MRKSLVIVLPLMLLSTGCTHLISEQSRGLADRTVTFGQLQDNPEAYRGKLVLLGGIIAAVTQAKGGTWFDIEEHRLDGLELPDAVTPSRGRFLAFYPGELDLSRYEPEALVTMMGEVTGKETRTLGWAEFTYPVIAIKEIQVIELPKRHPENDHETDHGFLLRW